MRFIFLKGKAPKEIHAILTEKLTGFLPGRDKDLSPHLERSHKNKFLPSYRRFGM